MKRLSAADAAPVRIGFVGLGGVAEMHALAYRDAPDLEMVAGCDVKKERVAAFSQRYGLRGFHTLEEMLRAGDLDVVCVLTPAPFHEPAVIACAAAGVDVLCEKPLALSVAACDRMIAACRENGVAFGYGASYRWLPAVMKARELIEAGAIGEIVLLRESAVGGSGAQAATGLGEAHFPKGGPGGSGMGLVDHGIHLVDLFSWLTGAKVSRTFGRGNVSGRAPGAEFFVLEFAGGALGELVYEDRTFPTELPAEGFFSWGRGWDIDGLTAPGAWQPNPGSIHVYGTRGSLRIFHYADALFLRDAAGVRQIELAGAASPGHFAAQMRAFAASIRSGSAPPVPAEAGREACRLVLSVYQEDAVGG